MSIRQNGALERIFEDCQFFIPATDGRATLAHASHLFPRWVDGDFERCETVHQSRPTERTEVGVFAVVKSGTFADMLSSVQGQARRYTLTQSQIISFVSEYEPALHPEGKETFFLFDVEVNNTQSELYVAIVDNPRLAGLRVRLARFANPTVWRRSNGHRLILPFR